VQPLGPGHHLALDVPVRKLSDEGVLIVGSGHMTHNLREFKRGAAKPEPYAREFQNGSKTKIEKNDLDSLANYRAVAPHAHAARIDRRAFPPAVRRPGRGAGKPSRAASSTPSRAACSRWTPTYSLEPRKSSIRASVLCRIPIPAVTLAVAHTTGRFVAAQAIDGFGLRCRGFCTEEQPPERNHQEGKFRIGAFALSGYHQLVMI